MQVSGKDIAHRRGSDAPSSYRRRECRGRAGHARFVRGRARGCPDRRGSDGVGCTGPARYLGFPHHHAVGAARRTNDGGRPGGQAGERNTRLLQQLPGWTRARRSSGPDGRRGSWIRPMTTAAPDAGSAANSLVSPEAKHRADIDRGRVDAASWESWEEMQPSDRCIQSRAAGPPLSPLGYNQNMHLFQTPDYVAILNEQIHDTRIIPLDGRPNLPPQFRQWLGEGRGRWEGDTLIVETTNFREEREAGPPNVSNLERTYVAGRTVHTRRCGHVAVRIHGNGSPVRGCTLDGAASHEEESRQLVRVHLSRGQLRHGGPAAWRARYGSRRSRSTENTMRSVDSRRCGASDSPNLG